MDCLSYKTISVKKKDIQKKWLLVDAEGLVLGRLASQLVHRLRGKHKPYYSPNLDCGDHIVVINAEKVVLTGSKLTDRVHLTHSGYPGGQKKRTPKQILEKNPTRLLENAVRKMLPKTRLGDKQFHNLHVYAGATHKHAAQN
ncbi:MAG: 50S ribosomal protein L13, partial [Bacteroidia bacterium]|nr:50S ribosomal protein L13 [Bacteroidia bacterium]